MSDTVAELLSGPGFPYPLVAAAAGEPGLPQPGPPRRLLGWEGPSKQPHRPSSFSPSGRLRHHRSLRKPLVKSSGTSTARALLCRKVLCEGLGRSRELGFVCGEAAPCCDEGSGSQTRPGRATVPWLLALALQLPHPPCHPPAGGPGTHRSSPLDAQTPAFSAPRTGLLGGSQARWSEAATPAPGIVGADAHAAWLARPPATPPCCAGRGLGVGDPWLPYLGGRSRQIHPQ